VTSDHGEEFFERGTWAHSWNQLFDEGVRVPLVARVPGAPAENRVRRQVSTLDVAPTLLDVAGVEPPDTMMGLSLLPAIEGASDEPPAGRDAIVEMLGHRNSYRYRLALRSETHRYIHDIERPHDNQLYDRLADSAECDNIYDKQSPISHQFDRARFDHMAPIVPDLLETEDDDDVFADTDPGVVERLRAMGYLS
jgi:arylsulfatase A-like enzyme